MTPTGLLLAAVAIATLVATGLIFAAVVRHSPRPRAAEALAELDLAGAMAAGLGAGREQREELVPASIAARHLGELTTAAELSARAVETDPDDGEAWLELALVRGHCGEIEAAVEALERAAGLRSDLAESVTLHRAWLALRADDRNAARRSFDEVEAPLETKLRTDLGAGDPAFADWFLQAAELWNAFGDAERAEWAGAEASRSIPGSRLLGS